MPFGKGDEFFLFHQRDNRNPEPFGWDLATTKDFVDYRDCGVAVPRGGDDEQDQFIFAGSVFEGEGQYHIFYTGYNRAMDWQRCVERAHVRASGRVVGRLRHRRHGRGAQRLHRPRTEEEVNVSFPA